MITGLCHYVPARAKLNLHFEPKQENSRYPWRDFHSYKARKQIPEIQLESAQPRSPHINS